jgi:hypothetical protein
MTSTTMGTEDTTRTLLLTVGCESMICGLSACIGFYFGGVYLLAALNNSTIVW